MRRKVLQDYANTLCQMFVGWRMGEDAAKLAQLPGGQITIDVLAGTSIHSSAGTQDLGIAGELQAWFLERLAVANIPLEQIEFAKLDVQMEHQHHRIKKAMRVAFEFDIKSVIQTDDTTYHGALQELHTWHWQDRN